MKLSLSRHLPLILLLVGGLAACRNDGANPLITDDRNPNATVPGSGAGNSATGASGGTATSPATGAAATTPGVHEGSTATVGAGGTVDAGGTDASTTPSPPAQSTDRNTTKPSR